jgi:quercetin dioxygenase-like cupin family protein
VTLGPYVAQAEEHEALAWIGPSSLRILVGSALTEGRLLIMTAESAQGSGAPVHVHSHEDEVFVLLEGTIVVWVGTERRELWPGAVAVLPRNIPHAYTVTSPTAKILEIVTPGRLEAAFREAGWNMRQAMPEDWWCDPAVVAQAMAKFDCQVLGPPPSRDHGPLRQGSG